MQTIVGLMRESVGLLVLATLAQGPMYGYRLLKTVRAVSGLARLNTGTLYPALHRMEAMGLVEARWDRRTRRPRKWYQLTETGQRALRDHAGQWKQYVETMTRVLDPAMTALLSSSILTTEMD